jgi:hypothetical protein
LYWISKSLNKKETKMGLTINVFRDNTPDCSMNGISKKFDELHVVNIEGDDLQHEKSARVALVRGNIPGSVKLVPCDVFEKNIHSQFGGNFGGCSDSRFRRAVGHLMGNAAGSQVAPIHDRVE